MTEAYYTYVSKGWEPNQPLYCWRCGEPTVEAERDERFTYDAATGVRLSSVAVRRKCPKQRWWNSHEDGRRQDGGIP